MRHHGFARECARGQGTRGGVRFNKKHPRLSPRHGVRNAPAKKLACLTGYALRAAKTFHGSPRGSLISENIYCRVNKSRKIQKPSCPAGTNPQNTRESRLNPTDTILPAACPFRKLHWPYPRYGRWRDRPRLGNLRSRNRFNLTNALGVR